ncbi:hypothetical protein PPSIR1_16875 [Plesiocystis pacifica SIR-1]|uniref:Uncharacterized protein n=1 Tax=Plesiocystis pacifica SIR-1 TaxID=391625 RepID=A6GJA5_9BACT|nr:hypothetical protein PPSIR1_16875 [Plesiocystis pacifica SIR-1]
MCIDDEVDEFFDLDDEGVMSARRLESRVGAVLGVEGWPRAGRGLGARAQVC